MSNDYWIMDKTNTRRVFFALWPDDDVRKKMVNTFKQSPQSKFEGRLMQPENLHLTLHFIGNVSAEKLACLDQAAQTVKIKPFELALSSYGHFDKAKIFWMGCRVIPQSLNDLHKRLAEAFSNCDFNIDKRVYAPHVSLMRKISMPGECVDFEAVKWKINEFVLVESMSIEAGVKYKVIRRY